MDTYDRRRDILINRPPCIAFVGDSHVRYLKEWLEFMNQEPHRYKLETTALGMSQFIYSGGSRWDTLYNRVQGIKVPKHPKQGDTLQQVLDNKKNIPEFFWICGTNDLDWYNDHYHEALRKKPDWQPSMFPKSGPSKRYKENHADWNQGIIVADITKHDSPKDVIDKLHDVVKSNIDTTVLKINLKIVNCKNFAMEIVPRMNWYPDVVKSACGISAYMRKEHHMTLTRVKPHILPVHYRR